MKDNTANEQKSAENMQTPSSPASEACVSVLLWKRLVLALLAGIPFFLTLQYTFHSWRITPVDRPNWIFLLAFLLLVACAVPVIKDSVKELKRSNACCGNAVALLFAFAFFGIYLGATFVRQINILRILSGMAFWWSCIWIIYGWRGAWALLPAFAALSLGCPSLTFLMCNHFLIQLQTAFYLKIGAVLLCAAACAAIMLTDYVMKYGTFCFLCSAALIIFCVLNLPNDVKPSPPFRPDLTARPEGITVTEIPLKEDAIRFFEGLEVHQYNISDGIFHCNFLEVKCSDDIHKIHPASHCLRSNGAVIQSESVVQHVMPDGRELSVTEIRSTLRGIPILTFVWYTGPKETLGSYFRFRSNWSSSAQWYSYQAVTEIYDGNEDAARAFLLKTLSRF